MGTELGTEKGLDLTQFGSVLFFLGGGEVGACNRHNVASWHSSLEAVHILAILRGFFAF